MKPFGQSKKDVEQLIRDRDNGWVCCEKCGHLVSKVDATHILKSDSSGRASYVYFGKSCKPAYDRIAYMPGGYWYFKAAEKAHDERINEDGSPYYYEGMGAPVSELHTTACRAHCDGPDCPCDGCIGMFSKPSLNMNDEVKFTSSGMGHSHPATKSPAPYRSDYRDLQKAKRLLRRVQHHINEMEQSWGGAYRKHTGVRGKTNHELACEVRSFFGEANPHD